MPTAFENLAPRVIGDLMTDLNLTAEQAAGIVGNLAAESGLQAIQEKHPISGRGGFGWAQWTGERRVAFEDWTRRWGFDPTSYAANYGFLLYELKNSYAYVIDRLRQTKTAKAAAETFGYHFEKFAGFRKIAGNPNYVARVRFAERALALYRNQQKPPEPAPVPVPLPDSKPATHSRTIITNIITAIAATPLGLKLFAGVNVPDLVTDICTAVAFLGPLLSSYFKLTASQPVTGSPLAQSVDEAKAQIANGRAEEDARGAEPSTPVSLFDMPMSVLLEELPALLQALHNLQPEPQKLLEHKPEGPSNA